MKNITIAIASSLIFLTSCQKEIFLPYRSVDPIAVIEGSVCQDSAVVRISTSVDMEAPFSDGQSGTGADVTITFNGKEMNLLEVSPGLYKPEGEFHAQAGTEYELTVNLDGNTYTSTSVMHPEVPVLKSGFRSIPIIGYKGWLYSAVIQDTPGEDNYYVYYFYEDGVLFYSDMTYDMGNDGGLIYIDIPVESDDEAVNGTDMHHTLPEGGTAVLEIRSIDKKTFNYLYSLMVSELSTSNILQDFEVKSSGKTTPKCGGYFNAYSSAVITEVFQRQETFPTDETSD